MVFLHPFDLIDFQLRTVDFDPQFDHAESRRADGLVGDLVRLNDLVRQRAERVRLVVQHEVKTEQVIQIESRRRDRFGVVRIEPVLRTKRGFLRQNSVVVSVVVIQRIFSLGQVPHVQAEFVFFTQSGALLRFFTVVTRVVVQFELARRQIFRKVAFRQNEIVIVERTVGQNEFAFNVRFSYHGVARSVFDEFFRRAVAVFGRENRSVQFAFRQNGRKVFVFPPYEHFRRAAYALFCVQELFSERLVRTENFHLSRPLRVGEQIVQNARLRRFVSLI